MIRALLSRFRRKPPPLTPAEARDRAASLSAEVLRGGDLDGFLIAAFHKPGDEVGEIVEEVKASKESLIVFLGHVIGSFLSNPESKDATLKAIVAALKASGAGRSIAVMPVMALSDDCDCPICTAGRAARDMASPSKPH